jgi:hypothetical protein
MVSAPVVVVAIVSVLPEIDPVPEKATGVLIMTL